MNKNENNYMPDLSKISLDEFKANLKTGRILPSRRSLLENIDIKFSKLQNAGLNNAETLRDTLKNSTKLKKLAEETDIEEKYLKILKREVNNLLPTPIKFIDIPDISKETLKKLISIGITDTESLFPYVCDIKSRNDFKSNYKFSEEEIQWLTKIVDVSRIKWVGPKLAGLIVDSNYDTVEKLANGKAAEVLKALNGAKNEKNNYQGSLGINDIESWINQVVSKTPIIIEYN
jgi:hypothetical protein